MRSLGAGVDVTHGSVEGLPSLDLSGGLVGPLLGHHLVHQMHHAGRAGRVRALSHTRHTQHAGVVYVRAYVCVCVVLWGCTYMCVRTCGGDVCVSVRVCV